jgi:uncharacterized membrane protein YraQ (UPF0718 family)
MPMVSTVINALSFAFAMGWEILWALILGFLLSGVVQAVVSKGEMSRLLPDDKPRTILLASALGAASSSCSYAAVALARSIFKKGGNFNAAMAFQFASTNLVLELGIILAVLMGWQFTLAEFVGGPIMILILVLILHRAMNESRVAAAWEQTGQNRQGRMEGHAGMDMSVSGPGSILARALSPKGLTAISHYYVMDWASVWTDIALGLLISGALAAWVPNSFWQAFFLVNHPAAAKLVGPLIGPLVAVVSFVCSVGNVPLAAVLWNGGISFGGVVSFLFADLIILPILNIYRKYYGWRVTLILTAVFYAAMVLAGYAVEIIFGLLHLVPAQRHALVQMANVRWDYTTFLNIGFGVLSVLLLHRFYTTGGPAMLRMMSRPMTMPMSGGSSHGHGHHHDHEHNHDHHGHH